ncbi:MAG: PRC-barrel domain-containing protein [Lachnospiraceae bacterium]
MRFYDLKQKEVINICNCKRLGYISDLCFDECTGMICEIIIPGRAKFCGCFGRETEFVIPFCKIVQIGPDIVLVNVREEDVDKKCNMEKE